VASIVFTQGCNFCCPFCHNADLWPNEGAVPVDEKEIFDYLAHRRGKISAIVVSGGEPTVQRDLAAFFESCKEMSLATKLDTNGSRPDVLDNLLKKKLLDFVAMDLKHNFHSYGRACGIPVDLGKIRESLAILRESYIDYELRTTVVPTIHTLEEVTELREIVAGVPRFTLQSFSPTSAADSKLRSIAPFTPIEMETLRPIFEPIVGKFSIR
jgi:pyruvate formate lyase activating enzyme